MGKYADLTGQRFGRLVVLSPSKTRKYGQAFWVCQCDCGTIKEFPTESLKKEHLKVADVSKKNGQALPIKSTDYAKADCIRFGPI